MVVKVALSVALGSTESKMAERDPKVIKKYSSFLEQASKAIGRNIDATTGGKSKNHRLGALDIGKYSNKLTDKEYDLIGKLAIDHGFRVGDEANHLHIDDREDAKSSIFYNINVKNKALSKEREKRAKKGTFEKYAKQATKLKSSMYTLPENMRKNVAKKKLKKKKENTDGYNISTEQMDKIRKESKNYMELQEKLNKHKTDAEKNQLKR